MFDRISLVSGETDLGNGDGYNHGYGSGHGFDDGR